LKSKTISRKQRRSFHQPRLRRESYGGLIQIDGSDHRWFEQRGEPCTLLVFIDDATSKLMRLRFVPSESTDSYFAALKEYVNDLGCPVAFYSDKHTVFRVNKPDAKGGSGMTSRTRGCDMHSLRMAGNLGFRVYVVADASATFDQIGLDGRRRSASDVHYGALSDLNGEFATVIETKTLLDTVLG
jgi:hypothetical protein